MNSTWIESNGCMRCWCENGRSRCFAEGCIAPPCENPRQIANVCCPVCDELINGHTTPMSVDLCPPLHRCTLVCEFGLIRDAQGCLQCVCASMTCPSPHCTLVIGQSSKSYCSCSSTLDRHCPSMICDKHCPYNYAVDNATGCLTCDCSPCPTLVCTKNCTYNLKKNEVGCPICVCQSKIVRA
jgi:hypothetical protein